MYHTIKRSTKKVYLGNIFGFNYETSLAKLFGKKYFTIVNVSEILIMALRYSI